MKALSYLACAAPAILACAFLFGTSAPATAQDADGGRQAEAGLPSGPINLSITAERRPRRCGETGSNGEILVCGRDRGEDVRVPSTSDSDPGSRDAQNTGVPRAPNVSGLADCSRGCIGIGGKPPVLYVIDVKDLPEPPKGSDAEKVARGEISDR